MGRALRYISKGITIDVHPDHQCVVIREHGFYASTPFGSYPAMGAEMMLVAWISNWPSPSCL